MQEERPINLRVPGPTPLPPAVREALKKQMINHRGPEYAAIQGEVLEHLRYFFQTKDDVLLFAASGTGGLEAAVVNTLSAGDPVLAVSIGAFGNRFAALATAYGAQVRRLDVTWGQAVTAEALATALVEGPAVKALLITCNETSTGAMNDLAALTPVLDSLGPQRPLLIVDAISALGAIDLPMDQLGIDVLITASQKAWMAPPGISMLGVGQRAWEAHASARMPRFYFDFSAQRKAQAKGQDAWTPSVTTMYALQTALRLMRDEGREAIIERHARIASFTQHGLKRLGFRLFAQEGHRSHTVTAAELPTGIEDKALLKEVRIAHNVIVANGQDRLAGSIIRIGHMGWVEADHIEAALDALAEALARQRQSPAAGVSVSGASS